MRFRMTAVLSALVGLTLLALVASAADGGKGQKGEKKKRTEGDKVEMKDVPAAVLTTAKKEAPNANFTSAVKHSAKKLGTVYNLEGKDGKYAVTAQIESSGDLLRFTKGVERKGKKASS